MIKIKVNYDDNKKVSDVIVSGHANYEDKGKDIVCASCSSIVITTINAILNFESTIEYNEEFGYIKIKVIKHDKVTDTLLLNMINMLSELEKTYKEYIKII